MIGGVVLVCPNCGEHIGRFELDQNCKKCGINLFYSQQKKLLSDDAKKCELEFASFRILVSKLKSAFIKGALPISRLVFTILCIGVVFIPFATVSVNASLFSTSFSIGGYGIYSAFSDGTLSALLSIRNISEYSAAVNGVLLVLLFVALILLSAVAMLAAEFFSFINIKRSAKAMAVFSVFGIVFSILSVVFAFVLSNSIKSSEYSIFNYSFGFGGVAAALAFLGMLIINILFIKRNIAPEIKQVDLDRIAMRKRVKAGEVKLSDLPLPVFESEEEKEKRLAEEEKSRKLEEEAKGGEKNG